VPHDARPDRQPGNPPPALVAAAGRPVPPAWRRSGFFILAVLQRLLHRRKRSGPVAQLDRASDFYSEGCRFESCRDRHFPERQPAKQLGGGHPKFAIASEIPLAGLLIDLLRKNWGWHAARQAWNDDMKPLSVATLSLILAAVCFEPASFALAAPDCSMSATLANWGEKSTVQIAVAPKESCQFPLKISGTIGSSEISKKPSHGKLKKINASTYLYTAKAKGTDTFAIAATGKNETASGTSEVLVEVTIK
jgi:hypothetical protein